MKFKVCDFGVLVSDFVFVCFRVSLFLVKGLQSRISGVQGYLAHQKLPPPRTLQ